MASRTTCRFWLQGHCRKGDNCKFEHSRNTGDRQDNNRYTPLNSNDSRNYSSNNTRGPPIDSRDRSRPQPQRERHIDQDQLRRDLSTDQPIWKLSCYSPRVDLPKQLFGGPDREFSPEEVRLRFYELAAQNKLQDAIQEAEAIYQQATTQIAKVLEDIPGAIRYLVNGFQTHPNRLDICDECTKTGVYLENSSSTGNSSVNTNTTVSPFPSSITSAQGVGANPFGQPSVAATNPIFGQSTGPTQAPSFGRPATLGAQPAFGQTGFPQAPSGVGFGNPAIARAADSIFGQAQQVGMQASPFVTASNPFSQNTPVVNTNPFSSQPAGEVGMQMSPSISKPFSTPFGENTATSALPQKNGGFLASQTTGSGATSSTTGLFGQVSTSGSGIFNGAQTPTTAAQIAQASTAVTAQKDAQGRLQRWNGRQVRYIDDQPCYKEDDGYWQRIWFPDGPPGSNKPEELPLDMPYGTDVEERFQIASNSRQFLPGLIPLVIPKREWTNWDF